MYTLRTFSENGVESNRFLGSEYSVVERAHSPKEFKRIFKDVFGLDAEDSNECHMFIVGNCAHPIYENELTYIVSSNGRTFSKIKNT